MPTERDKPHLSDKAAGQERQERLARALRENLRRRKAQARARADRVPESGDAEEAE